MNADDLLASPRTIKITRVEIRPGTEQPISIFYEGDNGKPYKACKSMARVMVHCWGADAKEYTGRSMTLYCDPSVKWGGMEVGGIRISHMSDIPRPVIMALTATKGNKKPFQVVPLVAPKEPPPVNDSLLADAGDAASRGTAFYQTFFTGLSKEQKLRLRDVHEGLKGTATGVDDAKRYAAPVENGETLEL